MIGNEWDNVLKEEYNKEYFKNIISFINKEYQDKVIYPAKENIFNAFKYTDYKNIKVVIIGQDPYHEEKQAEGLSFSVSNEVKRPPSLKNILKELESDLDIKVSDNNSLIPWAEEGVLLLNAVLTVEEHKAGSHQKIGWQTFTDEVIRKINEKDTPVVFILWGNYAKEKEKLITNPKHLIITSAHPSPLSAYHGFFGSKPFSKTNEFLKKNNIRKIKWNI